MKKTLKFTIYYLLFTIFTLILPIQTFAQNNQSLFDLSTPIRQIKIPNSQQALYVSLLPFTTLTIKPGSFSEDVTLSVYLGAWNNLKTAIPKNQSPISSYYLVFKSSNSSVVYPSIPLTIESYNNYVDTDTFFYPTVSDKEIDTQNQKQWKGHIKVNTELPVKDQGFIVAANINLKPNDISLHPNTISPSPSSIPNQTSKPSSSSITQNIYLIVALIVVTIAIIGIAFILLNRPNKPRQ
jgi:hypothetical protein